LQLLYNKKNCPTYHTWNNDETKIQASKQARAKGGSQQVYNIVWKSKEWFTMNCVINVQEDFY